MFKLKTPKFWSQGMGSDLNIIERLLTPFSYLYGWGVTQRLQQGGEKVKKPVICIGNIVAGGAGKTPTALAIANILGDGKLKPHFLLRGYGGNEEGPLRVEISKHTARSVGDEALLLARTFPTWISRDRPAGAKAAIKAGADIIIMDDGFQNPSLDKDISVIVIDGEYGLGNGRLIPAGPLREKLEDGLSRAEAVIILGKDQHDIERIIYNIKDIPVFFAGIKPENKKISGDKFYAFAGIGRPEKFKKTLEESGADVINWKAFPDHYNYTALDLEVIVHTAEEKGLEIITTEKDWVRLPEKFQEKIKTLPVNLVWKSERKIKKFLETKLGTK